MRRVDRDRCCTPTRTHANMHNVQVKAEGKNLKSSQLQSSDKTAEKTGAPFYKLISNLRNARQNLKRKFSG